jgi:hypothetical protein
VSKDLPNLELLIKLLKMTTSSNDGEVVVAARKANEQLAKFGSDWESLLRGKVTIIEDPFKSVDIPTKAQPRPAPPMAQRPPPPPPSPTPTYQPRGRPRPINPSPPPFSPPKPPPGASTSTLQAKTRRPSKAGAVSIEDLI